MQLFRVLVLLWGIVLGGRYVVAGVLPQNNPVPGGIAVIGVDVSATAPQFGRRQVMTVVSDQQRWAIVGLPLNIAPGQYILTPRQAGKTAAITFTVSPHRFGYFEISPTDTAADPAQSAGNADPKVLQIVQSLPRGKLSSGRPLFPFQSPVAGSEVIPFGTWLYSHSAAGYQTTGVQYLADTPRVTSPGDGVVYATVIRGDGMSVIIDHGQGLISMLYPLEPIPIKPLQRVRRGQVLGRTMKRKNGVAHLTWMTLLNASWVNPTLFLLPRP